RAIEVDGLEGGPAAAELVEEAGVGAVPAVDRLVRVAHDEDVPAIAPPGLEQPELERVHVLELVDEEVAEPPALGGGEAGVPLDGRGAGGEQVVEVHDVALGLGRLVLGEALG